MSKTKGREGSPVSLLSKPFLESPLLVAPGSSDATCRPRKVARAERVGIPKLGAEVDCIAFPYFRNGELVNIKFRALGEKAFTQIKGAEQIFYGLDDIADSKEAILVGGEPDKLALDEAGIRNVVSVPDGAPQQVKAGDPDPNDAKFAFLANCAQYLDRQERIILGVDNDGPGKARGRTRPPARAGIDAGGCAGQTVAMSNAKMPTTRC